jgi:hypothetical protein
MGGPIDLLVKLAACVTFNTTLLADLFLAR